MIGVIRRVPLGLLVTFILAFYPNPQTASCYLHKEASTTGTPSQLKTEGPDGISLVVQGTDRNNLAVEDYLIKGPTNGLMIVLVNANHSVSFTNPTAGTVSGRITKVDGTTPIIGATVRALQGASTIATAITNTAGDYTLTALIPGTYSIEASAAGYGTKRWDLVAVSSDETTTVNLSLDAIVTGPVSYIYDPAGRLIATVGSTDAVTYSYDAAGNLLSISRQSSSQLSIINVVPNSGEVGTIVTINGSGFSAVASENGVQFNGVAAVTTSGTTNQIVTSVPSLGVTGSIQIAVTTPAGTVTAPFTVLPANSGPKVQVTPANVSVTPGDKVQFTALVTGLGDQSVTWSVNGVNGGNASIGTISSTGYYSSANQTTSTSIYTIRATSVTPQALNAATYNAVNQQTSFSNQPLTYDLNGSLLSDGTNSYAWDARNRLVSITGPGLNTSFQYDAVGRRASKSVNGVTTSFLYDGSSIVQEQSVQIGNANVLSGGLDEVLVRSDGADTWSPLADGLGSLIALTDSAGSVQTDFSYGAFGQTANAGVSSSGSNQYTGRENDGAGLYYNRARYYSPTLQRFISEDPTGLAGGINLYAYVGNDPISRIDPFGLDWVDTALGYGANISAGFGDTISFGITRWIRSFTPGRKAVDPSSGAYWMGVGGGVAWGMAFGGAMSARAAGAGAGGAGTAVGTAGKPPPLPNPAPPPDFLGQPNGPAIPVPEGVSGPIPTRGPGVQYTGGSGGNGLDPRVSNVRIMDPTPRYPNGYVNYSNGAIPTPQSVNPYNGQTVGPASPWWHLPLGP